jgi:hypothetical protein
MMMKALVSCEAGLVFVLLPECDLPSKPAKDDVRGVIPCCIGTSLTEALDELQKYGAEVVFDMGEGGLVA